MQYSNRYKIKHSCAGVFWIGPGGRCRGTGRPTGSTGIKIIETNDLRFVGTKGTKECVSSNCRVEKLVHLLGELQHGQSDKHQINPDFVIFSYLNLAIKNYPLMTESLGTTAKRTAQLCLFL